MKFTSKGLTGVLSGNGWLNERTARVGVFAVISLARGSDSWLFNLSGRYALGYQCGLELLAALFAASGARLGKVENAVIVAKCRATLAALERRIDVAPPTDTALPINSPKALAWFFSSHLRLRRAKVAESKQLTGWRAAQGDFWL
jgi:hypothetical protein